MSKDKGGPAFPTGMATRVEDRMGMTLRDYFAAKALQGILANPTDEYPFGLDLYESDEDSVMSQSIRACYYIADRMLEERAK